MSDKTEVAIRLSAKWAIRQAFEAWAEEGWESTFPEVSQWDYERIEAEAERLLPNDVPMPAFEAAYRHLASRAEVADE